MKQTTATLIPALVKSNIPKASPIIPLSAAISIAPWINKCPKEVIGIIAPAPQYKTNLSYIPAKSKKAPITTNKVVICPGVNLVLSNIICPIKHINPEKIKAFNYILRNSDAFSNVLSTASGMQQMTVEANGVIYKADIFISSMPLK